MLNEKENIIRKHSGGMNVGFAWSQIWAAVGAFLDIGMGLMA